MTGRPGPLDWQPSDPFELPEWLGTGEVTWTAESPVSAAHVAGRLDGGAGETIPCDLVAVDEACPVPVADPELRTTAHRLWQRGEALVVAHDGRTALAVPGCRFTADLVLDAVERLARAVGAEPSSYAVRLVVGRDRPPGARRR